MIFYRPNTGEKFLIPARLYLIAVLTWAPKKKSHLNPKLLITFKYFWGPKQTSAHSRNCRVCRQRSHSGSCGAQALQTIQMQLDQATHSWHLSLTAANTYKRRGNIVPSPSKARGELKACLAEHIQHSFYFPEIKIPNSNQAAYFAKCLFFFFLG